MLYTVINIKIGIKVVTCNINNQPEEFAYGEKIYPSADIVQTNQKFVTKYCNRNVSKLNLNFKLPNLDRFIPSDKTLKKIAIVATFISMFASAALTGLSLAFAVASALIGNVPGAIVMGAVTIGYAGTTALLFMRLFQYMK